MILGELGRNLPSVTLDHIVKDLLSFFNGFQCLHEAKRVIEKQCAIIKEPGHECWSEDYIKQAWKETINEKRKSSRRRHWARVIMLQVVKSFVCDTCKQNAAQKNRDATTVEQGCETTPHSEDRIIQSNAELETAGPSRGEQMLGEGKKLYKASRSTESDSGVASGSQLSASSTDVAPSPAEVNPVTSSSNSETSNAALVNEDEDTLDNNCEQRKDNDDYELCSADVHDKENARCKNVLQSACGISQRMKGNTEHRSTQSNAEPQQTEQTKDTAKQQSGADSGATKRKCTDSGAIKCESTDNTGSESVLSTSGERDDSEEVPKRCPIRSHAREANSQTVYIRIPFSVMSGNESPSRIDTVVPDVSPNYKLIDRVPKLTEIRKRKSYAMLYDNRTRNAAWVYEILNSETLQKEVEREDRFSADQSIHPFYRASKGLYKNSYDRGHLASANNHRWCRKACDDTFLMSNISPQHKTLNRGKWNSLDNICQKKIKENIRNVHVYSGPLYLPGDGVMLKEIRDQVVPTHFFKVIIVEHEDGKAELECYKMPNDASCLRHTVSIEDIEKDSGLIFREKCCSEGETESLRRVTWTGENKDDKPVTTQYKHTTCVMTKVNVLTSDMRAVNPSITLMMLKHTGHPL